jgi:RHS repeat-associated protein
MRIQHWRRTYRLLAVFTAAAVTVALTILAVRISPPGHPVVPVQQWGTAAGRPHRVPATATIGRLAGDQVVHEPVTRHVTLAAQLTGTRRPRGALPGEITPERLTFPVRGRRTDILRPAAAHPAGTVAGYSQKTSRLIPRATGASRMVFANADGTRTAFEYQSPVSYQIPDGRWHPISTVLMRTRDGWAQRAAARPERFGRTAASNPLATFPVAAGQSVGLSLAGAAPAGAVVSGSSISYPGARPGGDLDFTAGTGVLAEDIVLRSPRAPGTWVFPLTLSGLRAETGSGGMVEFADAKGKVVAYLPHGIMTDSAVNPRSGDGAISTGVSYALTDRGRAIVMTLDQAWLHARSRVYPVTIDPSVADVNASGTTYVMSSSAGDYSGDTEIKVGTYDGGADIAKSFLAFSNVGSDLTNDTVLGVRLGVFNSWSYSCSPRPVSVYPVTSAWPVTGSKSWPGPSTGPAIATRSFATGWTPLGSSTSPCPAAWEAFDLGTGGNRLINGWTHGSTADDGLALGASSSDSLGWKKFTSINNPTGDPFLAITYTPYGATYQLASPTPVTQVWPGQNGAFAIEVTNTGASTWTPANGYELSYEAYNSAGKLIASHPVFTPMPTTVAPGASALVTAKVDELPVGTYAIDFDMYADATSSSPVSFSSQGIQPYAIGLDIPQPPPTVTGVYPPTGYLAPTATPQLATAAASSTGGTISYDFTLTCQPLPGTTCPASVITSGKLSTPYWTVSPAMTWDEPYTWTVTATVNGASTTAGPVSITPAVPQPAITSHLGDSNGQAFEPETGDYTTTATDASVAVDGPPLEITRSYNSLDPRTSGAFGAGWSTVADMSVTGDNDGTGNVVVTMADGSQARFAYNGTSDYAPPAGSQDALVKNSDGTWSLAVPGGTVYDFTVSGQISSITGQNGAWQSFTDNSAGELTTITDGDSGRTLTLTWSTPSGAGYPHVSSVTTSAPAAGQDGYTWTYGYTGDDLTQVCDPDGNCTSYSYGTTISHYRTAVLSDGPRSFYQLGEASGATTAADTVDTNLGTTSGTYSNVTLGAAGPLAGSSQTAAAFNGYSSYVSVAPDLISDSTDLAVELWFKDTPGTGGVLLSYDADPVTDAGSAGNAAARDPVLYVGGDGKLRGEFWNGSYDPITSATSVADGNWHYAVLSADATTQSLYLDGQLVGTLSGQINQQDMTYDTVGAGFWEGWPEDYNSTSPVITTEPAGYFTGSIADVAVYPEPLGAPAIAEHYALGLTPASELTQITLPSGRVAAQISYDTAHDRLSSYTGGTGGTWQIGLPATTGYMAGSESLPEATRSVTVISPDGYQEVYGYDALNGGRLISYTPGNGDPPRTFTYDAGGFLNGVTDSDGDLISMTNDDRGNVLSRTWFPEQPATGTSCCTTYYSYYEDDSDPLDPRNGDLTGVRDARSASATDDTYLTSYAYNSLGELTSSTTPATSDFPDGRTTSYTYSDGTQTAYGGSGTIPAGLPLTSTTPGGAVTSYAYYSDGDLAQVTEPSGARTGYTYDGLGDELTSTTYSDADPSGLTTSYTYNPVGQPLTVTFPGVVNEVTGVTHTRQDSYTYDADGNELSLTQSDLTGGDPSRVTTYTYNDYGQLATETDPGGATSGGSPQSQGASSAYPDGAATAYTYDPAGNVARMTDPDGNTYAYTYNEYNEVTQITLYTPSTSQSDPTATCTSGEVQDTDGGCDLVLDSYAYDPSGLLASATDAMGRITTYSYDNNQDLIAVQQQPPSGPGRQTAYTYDPAGNLIGTDVSDLPVQNQTVTDYTVDAADRVTSQVFDPPPAGQTTSGYLDRTTSYTYNADDDVTAETVSDPNGSATTDYGYDSSGDETSQTVQNGSADPQTTWTYNELGEQTSVTDPDGNTTDYGYDQAGDLTTVTGPPSPTAVYGGTDTTARSISEYGYDTYGDRTQVADPDGATSSASYDGAGQITSIDLPAYTPPGSSSAITATISLAYDGDGDLASETDPDGNVTSYTYDALGDELSQTGPAPAGAASPPVSTATYDSDGEQLSATDPDGDTTQATYDYFGDESSSTEALGNVTTYSYDYLGDPVRVSTPDGVTTTDTYDHGGELTSTADATGDVTSYAYDYAGRPVKVTLPDGTSTVSAYDPAGDLTSMTAYGAPVSGTAPELDSESYGYDLDGNQTSVTDADGHTTTQTYDAANQMTSMTVPVSSSSSDTTSYTYDAAGNQTSVTDGNGNTTWTTYNAWNLPESVIEPGAQTWTTAYDGDGLPSSVTQPGGITQSYSYNSYGSVVSESGSGAAAGTPAQTFGYDAADRMTSASAPGGTDTFSYDADGNLETTAGPSGAASFAYNGDGLMTSRTDAAGTTTYTYDADDRLATAADPLTGALLSYGYNADSEPASIDYSTAGAAGPAETIGYNQQHEVTSDTLTSASGSVIASSAYGYDDDGNLTSQTTNGYAGAGSVSYGYNDAGQLTSAGSGGVSTAYSYDNAGNLTQAGATSYAYDAQDQLTSSTSSAGTTTYGYTPSGALATVTSPSGSVADYSSNAFGQLVSGPDNASYGYDALGRLVTSDGGSLAYSGLGDTIAAADGQLYSYDPSGNLIGADTGSGPASATLTDPLHADVTGLFSPAPATSALTASASYNPYGSAAASSGTMPELGYQGDYTDQSTGLVDMNARWYDPGTGSFASDDALSGSPMPDPAGTMPAPYSYGAGDPLTTTDPTGHWGIGTLFDDLVDVAVDADEAVVSLVDAEVDLFLGILAVSLIFVFNGDVSDACGEDTICDDVGSPPDYGSDTQASMGTLPGDGTYPAGGVCDIACPVALPPPPPPQDKYAGPNPVAAPPRPAPLLHKPYIVRPAAPVKTWGQISGKHKIYEHTVPQAQPVAGTGEGSFVATGAGEAGSGAGVDIATQLSALGVPVSPIGAGPAAGPATGGGGSGGADGSAPAGSCSEEPSGDGATPRIFQVNSQGEATEVVAPTPGQALPPGAVDNAGLAHMEPGYGGSSDGQPTTPLQDVSQCPPPVEPELHFVRTVKSFLARGLLAILLLTDASGQVASAFEGGSFAETVADTIYEYTHIEPDPDGD